MKLQIMSDLHLEMHADRGVEFIRHLDPTGVEVLVLAGDITMARHCQDPVMTVQIGAGPWVVSDPPGRFDSRAPPPLDQKIQ